MLLRAAIPVKRQEKYGWIASSILWSARISPLRGQIAIRVIALKYRSPPACVHIHGHKPHNTMRLEIIEYYKTCDTIPLP
jgi:hypothetical protein